MDMTYAQRVSTFTAVNVAEDHLDELADVAATALAALLDAIEIGSSEHLDDDELASMLQKVLLMLDIDASIECSVV